MLIDTAVGSGAMPGPQPNSLAGVPPVKVSIDSNSVFEGKFLVLGMYTTDLASSNLYAAEGAAALVTATGPLTLLTPRRDAMFWLSRMIKEVMSSKYLSPSTATGTAPKITYLAKLLSTAFISSAFVVIAL